jgi:tetratricopeptide (TPR) repeat protein
VLAAVAQSQADSMMTPAVPRANDHLKGAFARGSLGTQHSVRGGTAMGFRMRKSIKVVPGVRLNLSKTGVGASIGAGGVRYSAHSSGRRTVSARTGIPGVYYQQSAGKSRSSRSAPAGAPSGAPKKPGLFAPKGEKELYKAVKAQDPQAIKRVGEEHSDFRLPSYSLAGLLILDQEPAEAERLLDEAFATGNDPAEEKFVSTYLFTHIRLSIAEGVAAELPINRDAVGLALAELKQKGGNLDGAIAVVEQLEPTTYSAVSLAELYAQSRRWDEVVELTEGVKNEDDASALLCVFRGRAFREQAFHDAAHEALKEALRARSRAAEIRHLALAERAQNFVAQGKKSQARKDLERILADDSSYEGVREQLAALSQ